MNAGDLSSYFYRNVVLRRSQRLGASGAHAVWSLTPGTSLLLALAGVMGFHDIPPPLTAITARLVEIVLANQKIEAFYFLYYGA